MKPVAYAMFKDDEFYDAIHPKQYTEHIGSYTIPLYTHPVKELNDGGEPVKNATYWKRQYNEVSAANDRLKSGLYHANEQIKYLEGQLEVAHQLTKMRLENSANPVKELTDEEIDEVYGIAMQGGSKGYEKVREFARAILEAAQKK